MKNITRTLLTEIELKVIRTEMNKAWEAQDKDMYEAIRDNASRLGDHNDEDYWEYVYDQYITNEDITEDQFINMNI